MGTVTFIGEEPEVVWCGVRFERGVATKTDHPHILAKAKDNQFFKVAGERKAKAEETGEGNAPDKATAGGAKAKADGKPRKAPVAYHGKPEADRWLAGYDGADTAGADDGQDA